MPRQIRGKVRSVAPPLPLNYIIIPCVSLYHADIVIAVVIEDVSPVKPIPCLYLVLVFRDSRELY